MGDTVAAGATLAVLKSSELDYQMAQARRQAELLEWEIAASGTSGRFSIRRLVAGEELRTVRQKLVGLRERQRRLTIVSPLAGTVTEPQDAFFVGQWVPKNSALFKVMDFSTSVVEGYVRERDLAGLGKGAKARFYPDDPGLAPVPMQLERIEATPTSSLSRPSLSAAHGGQISTRQLPDGTLVPEDVYYRVFLKPVGKTFSLPQRSLRGVAMVSARPRSLAERAKTLIWAVLVRESGF